MGDTWLSTTTSEKDLEIFVDHELNTNQQCDVAIKKTNPILDYIKYSFQILQGASSPLFGSVRPHLKYCVQFWTSHFKKDANKLELVQRRPTRMIRGAETKPYE